MEFGSQSSQSIIIFQGPHGLINELLSIPHTSLHSYERVMIACKHSTPFYHIIATDFSVLLMDERFTNHPVHCISDLFSVITAMQQLFAILLLDFFFVQFLFSFCLVFVQFLFSFCLLFVQFLFSLVFVQLFPAWLLRVVKYIQI